MKRARLEHLAKRGDPEAIKELARLDLRRSTIVRRAETPAALRRLGTGFGTGHGYSYGWGNGYGDGASRG